MTKIHGKSAIAANIYSKLILTVVFFTIVPNLPITNDKIIITKTVPLKIPKTILSCRRSSAIAPLKNSFMTRNNSTEASVFAILATNRSKLIVRFISENTSYIASI